MASSFLSNSISPHSTTISFSSSVSTSLSWRRFTAFPSRPRRRTFSVQSKIREIFMPALSSTMTEGKIVSWVKSEGDVPSKSESVVVVESDKADMDVETFYDGILVVIVVGEGETAPAGAPIGLLAETEEEVVEAKAKVAKSASSTATPAAPNPHPDTSNPAPAISQQSPPPPAKVISDGPRNTVATPYAKKLAKQHKVDIGLLVGTGPNGRVTPADVEAAAGITPSKSNVASPVAV